jgi:hypothetical protein
MVQAAVTGQVASPRRTRKSTAADATPTAAESQSIAGLRRLKFCPSCSSQRLAPTTSLLGHVLALGLLAPFYPRGKKCPECAWCMEADY